MNGCSPASVRIVGDDVVLDQAVAVLANRVVHAPSLRLLIHRQAVEATAVFTWVFACAAASVDTALAF